MDLPASLQSRSRAVTPGTVVLLAAASTATVPHSLAAHTVTHGATSAANAFVLWPARLRDPLCR